MFNAEVLADSLSPQGHRITTMKITFPRMVLAEFNTHRMFSRNSASSRAIPFRRMVQMVEENPFIPIAWQKDHKGMQGTEYLNSSESKGAIQAWVEASRSAVARARYLNELGNVTKQLCNRLLEPFMWHTVLVTATEYDNFFELRCPKYEYWHYNDDGSQNCKIFKSKKDFINAHGSYAPFYNINGKKYNEMSEVDWIKYSTSGAEIHIQTLAEAMWDAYNESTPKQLQAGEWHIPFGENMDLSNLPYIKDAAEAQLELLKIKIATARCARISYETLGDNPKIDYEADIRLHDMLLESGHMSPFEHCARAMHDWEYNSYANGQADMFDDPDDGIAGFPDNMLGWCRNFKGFIQYRHMVEQ